MPAKHRLWTLLSGTQRARLYLWGRRTDDACFGRPELVIVQCSGLVQGSQTFELRDGITLGGSALLTGLHLPSLEVGPLRRPLALSLLLRAEVRLVHKIEVAPPAALISASLLPWLAASCNGGHPLLLRLG